MGDQRYRENIISHFEREYDGISQASSIDDLVDGQNLLCFGPNAYGIYENVEITRDEDGYEIHINPERSFRGEICSLKIRIFEEKPPIPNSVTERYVREGNVYILGSE